MGNDALKPMQSFFSQLFSRSSSAQNTTPTLRSYGQDVSGVLPQTIQEVIEWLMFSLMQYNYFGKAHLFWMEAEDTPVMSKQLKQAVRCREPIFMYRCDDRSPAPLDGYYWRMMPEHQSMRVYQLELKEDEESML